MSTVAESGLWLDEKGEVVDTAPESGILLVAPGGEITADVTDVLVSKGWTVTEPVVVAPEVPEVETAAEPAPEVAEVAPVETAVAPEAPVADVKDAPAS